MKTLALAVAVASMTFSVAAPSSAEACAMRKFKKPEAVVAKNALKQAQDAEKAGNLHSAIRHYERAMNGKGTKAARADAAQAAARLHLKLGRTGAGINRLKKAIALNPTAPAPRVALGALVLEQDPKLAATHLKEAIKRKAADPARNYLMLADAFARQGLDAEALKALAKAETNGADAASVAAIRDTLAPEATTGVAARS